MTNTPTYTRAQLEAAGVPSRQIEKYLDADCTDPNCACMVTRASIAQHMVMWDMLKQISENVYCDEGCRPNAAKCLAEVERIGKESEKCLN